MSNYFTLARVEKGVMLLADTEEEYAELKANKDMQSKKLEVVLASLVMKSNEKTHSMSVEWAKTQQEYIETLQKLENMLESYYLLDVKRHRAELTVEVWRSVNAARGRGNPT